jgi:signal peptidase II
LRYLLFCVIAVAVCGLDLATKYWAFARLGFPGVAHEQISVIGTTLVLETSLNEGALFGLGQGQRILFITLSALAVGGICSWLVLGRGAGDMLLTVALGLVTGGILGNLWDRMGLHGLTWPYGSRIGEPVFAVRDWIHFELEGVFDWPVFNIADSALVIGVALLMWQTFRTPESPRAAGSKPPA